MRRRSAALPASHGVVSVQHLLAQLAVLDPTGELNVSELVTQQLRPQEALQIRSDKQNNPDQRLWEFHLKSIFDHIFHLQLCHNNISPNEEKIQNYV